MSAFLPIKESPGIERFLLYAYSTTFIISGITMLFRKTARLGAMIAFFLFLLALIYPHLVYLFRDFSNPGQWTVVGETLAYVAGALILVGIFSSNVKGRDRVLPVPKNKIQTGRILFAISLLIFSVQHFKYGQFIATLIPDWLPLREPLAYLVGVFFLIAFFSFLLNKKTQIISALMGFMFLFWVVCLHAPRVIAHPNKENEWTSLFIAVGFCGIFFMLVDVDDKK